MTKRECASLLTCLVHSIHVQTLFIFGGTISATMYKSYTCVGLRHPVVAPHDLFRSESSMCYCMVFQPSSSLFQVPHV